MSPENLEPQEKRREFAATFVNESDKFVVYCQTCRAVIYKGNDQNYISMIVKTQLITRHLEAYSEGHVVEVIFLRRKADRTSV